MPKSTPAFIPALAAFEKNRIRNSKGMLVEQAQRIDLWMADRGFNFPGGKVVNREDTLWFKVGQARTNYERSLSEPNKQALKQTLESIKTDLVELSGLLADFERDGLQQDFEESARRDARKDILVLNNIIGQIVSNISFVLDSLDSPEKSIQERNALLVHWIVRSFYDLSNPAATQMLEVLDKETSNLKDEARNKKATLKLGSPTGILKYFIEQACKDPAFVEDFSKKYPFLFNNLFHQDILSLFNAVEKNQEALDSNGALEIIYNKFCSFYDVDGSSRKAIADLREKIAHLKRHGRTDLINDAILRSSVFSYRAPYGESEEARGLNRITRMMLFKIQRDEKVFEKESRSVEIILEKLMRLESHLGSCFTVNDFYRFSDVNMDRANRSAWAFFAEVSERINRMVILSIVSEDNMAVRDYRILQWILVANDLIKRNFYSLASIIYGGLSNSSVYNSIPDQSIIEKINDFRIFSPIGNYREYKSVVSDVFESGSAYYPLVPPIKTELTFVIDGNKIGEDENERVIAPFVTQTRSKHLESLSFSKEQEFGDDLIQFIELSDPSLHPLQSKDNPSDIRYLNDFLLALDSFQSSDYSLERFFEYSARMIGFLPSETKIKVSDLNFDPAPGVCSEEIRAIVNKNKGKDTVTGKVKDEDRDKGISGIITDFFINKKDKIKRNTPKGHVVSSVVSNLISKQTELVQDSKYLAKAVERLQSEESTTRNRVKAELARNIQYKNDLLIFLTITVPKDRKKAADILRNGTSEAKRERHAADLLQAAASAAASSIVSLASLKERLSNTYLGKRLSMASSSNISMSGSQTQSKPATVVKPNPYVADFENPDKDPFIKGYLNDTLMLLEFQASYDDAGDLNSSPDLGKEVNDFLNALELNDKEKGYLAWHLFKNLDHLNALRKVLTVAAGNYAKLQIEFSEQVDDVNIVERLEEMGFTSSQIAVFTVLFYSSPNFGSKQKDAGFNKFFIQLMDPEAFSKWTLEPAALADKLGEDIEMTPLSGMPSGADDMESAEGARSTDGASFLSLDASTIGMRTPGMLTAQNSVNPDLKLADVVPVLETNVAVLTSAINEHVSDVPKKLIAHHLANTYADAGVPIDVKKLRLRSNLHQDGDEVIERASKVHLTAHLIDNVLSVQDTYKRALDAHVTETALDQVVQDSLKDTNKILKELKPKAEAKVVLGSLRERMDQFDRYNVSDVVFLTPPLTLFEVVYYLNPMVRRMCNGFKFSFSHFKVVDSINAATFRGCDNVKSALIAVTEVFYNSTAEQQKAMNQIQILNNMLEVVYDSLVHFILDHKPNPLHPDSYTRTEAINDFVRVIVNLHELYKINISDTVVLKADMSRFVSLFKPGTNLASSSSAELLTHFVEPRFADVLSHFNMGTSGINIPEAAGIHAKNLLMPTVPPSPMVH